MTEQNNKTPEAPEAKETSNIQPDPQPTQQEGAAAKCLAKPKETGNLAARTTEGAQNPHNDLEASFKKMPQPNPEHEDGNGYFPVVFSDSTSEHNAYALVVEERKVLLAEPAVEEALKDFAGKTAAQHLKDSDPKIVLQNALSIYCDYDRQVSFGENVQNGIATCYRIQEGLFLKRLKEVVENVHGKRNWVKWVEENIRHKTYRVIRQYIQLAETPNVTHYSPLGKELLVKLVAMLKSNKQLYGKDPIGKLLSDHGITYNPKRDQGSEHLENMRVIRVAMNYQKIMDAKLTASITREHIERLVEQGKTVTQALINELLTAREDGKDMAEHMEAVLDDSGKLQGLKSADVRRAAVQSAFERFSKLASELYTDNNSLEALSNEQIEELMEKLEDLQDKINEQEDQPEDELDPWEAAGAIDTPPAPGAQVLQNPKDVLGNGVTIINP